MSAFLKAAPEITNNVAGIFGIAASEPAAVKAGVVLGITKLDGKSFGNDAKLGYTYDM